MLKHLGVFHYRLALYDHRGKWFMTKPFYGDKFPTRGSTVKTGGKEYWVIDAVIIGNILHCKINLGQT